MRKIGLFLFLLVGSVSGFAQTAPQYLPQFAAGSLPGSEWNTVVSIQNPTADPNSVLVEFFDEQGNPLSVATDKGVSDKFSVEILPNEIQQLEVLRNNQFMVGWVKTTSFALFTAYLKFQQFVPGGNEVIGQASVFSSPVQNVLTFPLKSTNGVALVNPESNNANVNFAVLRGGQKVREGSFGLRRGGHIATFFSGAPFLLEGETGVIVISSNIPLSGVALDFDGLSFSTLPSLPTPRRIDSQRSQIKIGFVYINSDDRQPMKKEDVQNRIGEAVAMQKFLLDRELPLNGFRKVDLPYDLDDNGLPKVLMVQGGNRSKYFDRSQVGMDRIRWDTISADIKPYLPANWSFQVIFTDFWKVEANGNLDDVPNAGGGGFFEGTAWLSARYIPFMKKSLFGNKTPYRNLPISEFGGKPMPPDLGTTLEDLADGSFQSFNHESGHAMFELYHSSAGETSRLVSMMGRSSQQGCFNPSRPNECILLPVEAHGISIGTISRLNDFDWISADPSWPSVQIIQKEITGTKLKVTFKAEDLKNGIASVAIQTLFTSPWTRFWKHIGHLDNLDQMTIEADVSGAANGIYLYVINNQGNSLLLRLF